MMRLLGCMAASLLAGAHGCWLDETFSRYGAGGPPLPEYNPATTAVAVRVDSLGREVLAANPDFLTRPVFHTLGVVEPALFHRGDQQLFISEGLVTRCANDGELAALLCVELGQMEAERQLREAEDWRDDEAEPPPIGVGLTPDVTGAPEAADFTRTAELAEYEHKLRSRRMAGRVLEDPRGLARRLLTRAGYDETLLATVEPWVREVKRSRALERQFNGPVLPTP